MRKRELTFLGAGMFLAVAAIAVGTANRTIKAQDKAAIQAAEEQEYEASLPPPKPKSDPRNVMRREMVGELELRVTGENEAKLFTAEGRQVGLVRGFQGARVIPNVRLFGSPVVEFAGKSCRDPCNPTFALIASPGGKPKTVLEAQGIAKLEDLDGDGVPEALVDHLVRHTSEVVTLPYALQKERFVPAYPKFPEGVDRQVEELSKSAERLCESKPEGECRDTLLALFAVHLFSQGGELKPLLSHLKIEQQLKAWGSDEGLQKELERELKEVVR